MIFFIKFLFYIYTMFDCSSFLHRMGWSQKDLADRLKIATSTVGMWCTGKSTPSYSVILELIDLGINAEELFGRNVADKFKEKAVIDDSTEFEERVRTALRKIIK